MEETAGRQYFTKGGIDRSMGECLLRDTYAKDIIDDMNETEFAVAVTTVHEVRNDTNNLYDHPAICLCTTLGKGGSQHSHVWGKVHNGR